LKESQDDDDEDDPGDRPYDGLAGAGSTGGDDRGAGQDTDRQCTVDDVEKVMRGMVRQSQADTERSRQSDDEPGPQRAGDEEVPGGTSGCSKCDCRPGRDQGQDQSDLRGEAVDVAQRTIPR
jgi:hypothetical protein